MSGTMRYGYSDVIDQLCIHQYTSINNPLTCMYTFVDRLLLITQRNRNKHDYKTVKIHYCYFLFHCDQENFVRTILLDFKL